MMTLWRKYHVGFHVEWSVKSAIRQLPKRPEILSEGVTAVWTRPFGPRQGAGRGSIV
jgi:hypothetical protein